jgi:hypothetical protein
LRHAWPERESTCRAMPNGSTVSCSNCSRFRTAATTIRSTASRSFSDGPRCARPNRCLSTRAHP